MQTREIQLTELETAYEVVKELRTELSYDEFEDLVYAMRHQEYKMYGLFNGDELITYAGVSVQVNLYWKRHLFVYDLVTKASHHSHGYGKEMLIYLHDIARMFQCEHIVLTSNFERSDAHRFYKKEGFEKTGYTLLKTASVQ
ncbi:MAG: GNAT family N-acetyltransferase, partial [Campylobacterota bacterium]|nr:GNAT family N-acetyltransferase [Campylobacterota bacterium]